MAVAMGIALRGGCGGGGLAAACLRLLMALAQERAHGGERLRLPVHVRRRPAFAVQPRMAAARQHRHIGPRLAALYANPSPDAGNGLRARHRATQSANAPGFRIGARQAAIMLADRGAFLEIIAEDRLLVGPQCGDSLPLSPAPARRAMIAARAFFSPVFFVVRQRAFTFALVQTR